MAEDASSPGRVRWLRWLGWGFGILVLILFTAHSIWTSMMSSRMAKAVDALQRAGEPILRADFVIPDVNSLENGGMDILAAAKLIDAKSEEWQKYEKIAWALKSPLTDDERAVLEAFARTNSPALARLEQAKDKPRLDWDIDLLQPMAGLDLANLTEVQQLADAVAMQALLDHAQGNDHAAMEAFDRLLLISRFIDRRPSLMSHMVALGTDVLATQRITMIAPDLRIGSGPNDASPANIRRIIEHLLNDEPSAQGLRRGLRGERMLDVGVIHAIVDGTPIPAGWRITGANLEPAARYFIRPLYYRAGARIIEIVTATLAAADEKSWPAARARLPIMPLSAPLPINAIEFSLLPSMDRVMENHFRGLTDRHLAAVALAIRWHAIEHDGRLPPTLADLVPNYLPTVPQDRFSAALSPFIYKPDPDAPFVYSVGLNGKDDGGSRIADPKQPRAFNRPLTDWQMLDRVQPLYRVPRTSPPAANEAGDSTGR